MLNLAFSQNNNFDLFQKAECFYYLLTCHVTLKATSEIHNFVFTNQCYEHIDEEKMMYF